MKKERGITLVSLIVYIILMLFAIAGLSAIMSSFYSVASEYDSVSGDAVAYSKFNMYFINDIKRADATIEEYQSDSYSSYIIISYTNEETGNKEYAQYSMQNNILYRNEVKICDDVESMSITANKTKQTIEINMTIGGYEKTTNYVIEDFNNVNTTVEI